MITNNPHFYHLLLRYEVWLSESEYNVHVCNLKECHSLAENREQFKLIDKAPDEPCDPLPNFIEQSHVTVKRQTVRLQSLFQREERGNHAAQANLDDVQIIPINDPEEASSIIPFVELNDAPVASNSASVAEFHNLDEPDPEHLRQGKKIWEQQSG